MKFYLLIILSLAMPAYAFFGLNVPKWLDDESRQLALELNRGIGQSQNQNFIKAKYRNGEMKFYYSTISTASIDLYGAVVDHDRLAMIQTYCDNSYYRQRLEAGLVYRHVYEGNNAPAPLIINLATCLNRY